MTPLPHDPIEADFLRELREIEAEAMGFDWVGSVEHHFTDYAACPDPMQALTWTSWP